MKARPLVAYEVERSGLLDELRIGARRETPTVDRYRRDPFAHLEDGHVRIVGLGDDPDAVSPIDFRPYDHQRDVAAAWIDLDRLARTGELRWRNAIVEKTRQMGFTWEVAWLLLWGLMYHPMQALAVHLRENEVVDARTTESIFGRILYMARSQLDDGSTSWPDALRPTVVASGDSIRNPLTGAYIIGRGAVSDPGRGGRYTNALLDEFAFIAWGDAVHGAVSRACPSGRLYGSTAHGKGNRFYRLAAAPPPSYTVVSLHWSRHPLYGRGQHVAGADPDCPLCAAVRSGVRYTQTALVTHRYPGRLTSPWLESAMIEMTDEEVASELEIDYETSVGARIYPEFDARSHVLAEIPYDPALPVELSFDYGYSPSYTAVGIWQDGPDALRKIGEVEVSEATPDQVAALIRDALAELGLRIVETEPRFTSMMLAIGDPAGRARELSTGRSIVDEYAMQGFTIISETFSFSETVRAVKRLLGGFPKPVVYSAAGCPRTILHMEQNRWRTDRYGAVIMPPEPRNDAHNHMARADAYYVRWKYEPPEHMAEQSRGYRADAYDAPALGLPYRRIRSWDEIDDLGDGDGDGRRGY